jgi:putative hydrolase of the HAD superfamily
MNDLKNIKALTFDFWETLYNDTPSQHDARNHFRMKWLYEYLKKHVDNLQLEELTANYAKIKKEFHAIAGKNLGKSFGISDLVLAVVNSYHIAISEKYEEICELIAKMDELTFLYPPIINEDAYSVVKQLAQKYPLAIISNTHQTNGKAIRKLLARDGLLTAFSKYTFSDEVGIEKPSKLIFLQTLAWLELAPEEVVHIGDNKQADYYGALNAGMQSVWLNTENEQQADNVNVLQIKRLLEIPNLLLSK